LQGSSCCNYIEGLVKREIQDVAEYEPQIGKDMIATGDDEQRFIAIQTNYAAIWTHHASDICGDRSSATPDIENGHSRSKEVCQAPMIPPKRSAIQYARIRPVGLLR
jgi:hypothetical protein